MIQLHFANIQNKHMGSETHVTARFHQTIITHRYRRWHRRHSSYHHVSIKSTSYENDIPFNETLTCINYHCYRLLWSESIVSQIWNSAFDYERWRPRGYASSSGCWRRPNRENERGYLLVRCRLYLVSRRHTYTIERRRAFLARSYRWTAY